MLGALMVTANSWREVTRPRPPAVVTGNTYPATPPIHTNAARERRRVRWNAKVCRPLRETWPTEFIDELVGASGGWGPEALIARRAVARLDTGDAKRVMLRAAPWVFHGALAGQTSHAERHAVAVTTERPN